MTPYETDRVAQEYLLLHYGGAETVLGRIQGPTDSLDFPARLVAALLDPSPLGPGTRALDVGCAVGRSSFELARHCGEVVGIDFSRLFIETARGLRETGRADVLIPVEGEITRDGEVRVPSDLPRENVRFEIGDAMDLPPDLGAFDVVLAANLLCRLPDPMRFLDRLPQLVKPRGQLLLTTPFSWLEDYTPRDRWLGGRKEDGRRSVDVLREVLSPHFNMVRTADLPFLIREHSRKFQYGVASGTTWVRRHG